MDSSILKITVRGDSMWPSFKDGETIDCIECVDQTISIGDIVVFPHPLKNGITCLKRVSSISDSKLFVEGDNPDPTASEDSHNFGMIAKKTVLAIAI